MQRRQKRGRTDPTLLSPVAELWSCGVRQMTMPPTTAAVDLRAGTSWPGGWELCGDQPEEPKAWTLGADGILLRNGRRRKAERSSPL